MNDDKPEKESEVRRSRFEWSSSDIVIIRIPDQETQGKPAPATPKDPNPAELKPPKDEDQQDG